jgi:transcriptional regulator GlxA family with amidase domain
MEFLENTHLLIDQVAERVGFADATNFRKAFRTWTDHFPPTIAALASITHRPDIGTKTRPTNLTS